MAKPPKSKTPATEAPVAAGAATDWKDALRAQKKALVDDSKRAPAPAPKKPSRVMHTDERDALRAARAPQDDASLFAAAVASIPKDAVFDKHHPAVSDDETTKRGTRTAPEKGEAAAAKQRVSQEDKDRALFASMVGDVRRPR